MHVSLKLGAVCMVSILATLGSCLDGKCDMYSGKFCLLLRSKHGVLHNSLGWMYSSSIPFQQLVQSKVPQDARRRYCSTLILIHNSCHASTHA